MKARKAKFLKTSGATGYWRSESVLQRCGLSETTHTPIAGSIPTHILAALSAFSGLKKETKNTKMGRKSSREDRENLEGRKWGRWI